MRKTLSRSLSNILLIAFVAALSVFSYAGDNDWKPVSPEDMAMKTSSVEPDADAEALFWEVRVDDSSLSMVMKHYVRVKIFTERGREKYSKVDIPYVKQAMKIRNIQARVIKPDGTISQITKADVFEREITKTDDIKIKAKSFAVPNIEVGVIVEYKYEEYYEQGSADDMRMIFQHDIPVKQITYYFKPYDNTRYFTYNMQDNKFIKDKSGFYRATMENVPALKEEPFMPPQDEIRSWILLFYLRDVKTSSLDFWSRYGGFLVYAY